MRVVDAFLGQGIGRAILRHIVEDADERGIRSLWLETGVTGRLPPGAPAVCQRRVRGVPGVPALTPPNPLSTFMTRRL